jgi:hypothetical protein
MAKTFNNNCQPSTTNMICQEEEGWGRKTRDVTWSCSRVENLDFNSHSSITISTLNSHNLTNYFNTPSWFPKVRMNSRPSPIPYAFVSLCKSYLLLYFVRICFMYYLAYLINVRNVSRRVFVVH